MKETSQRKEKRKHPRLPVSLSIKFQMDGREVVHSGVILDVSESGLLIQAFKDMLVGTRLNIEILFPKGFELSNFHAVAEIIWKEIYCWEGWEGYQYGLKFIQILDKDHLMLERLLNDSYFLKEVYLFDKPQHNSTLIVKVR
jgi:hypothetical protein